MVKIYEDYKDHADFLTVYVREAHPTDEWQMKSNVKDDVCYAQPKTLEQRMATVRTGKRSSVAARLSAVG